MTFANEASWDRATRMVAGVLLLGVGAAGLVEGWLGAALVSVGAMALATGIVGWCPGYTVFGISTRAVVADHCPHCRPDIRA